MDRGRPLRFLTGFLLAPALLAGACTSTGGGRGAGGWFRDAPGARGDPWQIPSTAFPTQRLFRVKYEGPEGRLAFKLTLYLEGEERFRMRAADGLGRRIWELDVDEGGEALWLDHKNKVYCTIAGARRTAVIPLARLPLVSLPKLLLGRLPSRPAAELQVTQQSIYYRDERGQLWNGGLSQGHLDWWTLVDEGRPTSWWRREGDESVFVDLEGAQQLRWREVVREPLTVPPGPLEVPERYEDGDCV